MPEDYKKYKELSEFFINEVVRTVKSKNIFSWEDTIDSIALKGEGRMHEEGLSILKRIYGLKLMGSNFDKELESLLANGYIIPIEKEDGKYILSKKGIAAKRFGNLKEYEISINKKLEGESNKYFKTFDREIISFLNKRPQKYGDISSIVNKFINGSQDNAYRLHRELIYLSRDKDIIEIKELPDDPMQMQDDWWGNFIGINIIRGDKVEGLIAKLSNGYLKLSYWERNPIKTKMLEWIVPYALGIITMLFTCKSTLQKDTSKQKKQIVPTGIKLIQKKYDGDTNYGSLHSKKDSFSLKNSNTPTR